MIFIRYSFLLLSTLLNLQCRTVEVFIPSQEIKLFLKDERSRNLSVHLSEGAGRFRQVNPENKNLYNFKTPAMDGGYSAFLFFKYNVHNPAEYEIIQIRENEKKLKELSLQNIQKLKKDGFGFSILEMDR
ncbi:MAG TPA: hypothetical protein PK453_11970 [Leptospiraceae bacterium]|nr:hypothetical protein [Leptospiraceae bacterium]HNF25551.1 hypothetical protein [Leptospiraceae bacterium]HNI28771.1 hypothetical protein [Leptospiraceae bacterium]HNI96413.1 hypothetical protein [Leptospiraceae bacterium]HNM04469.1 hypothetical protein [Leptospiraceae bacterium]